MAKSEQTEQDARLVCDPEMHWEIDMMATHRGITIKSLVAEIWHEHKTRLVKRGKWVPTRTERKKR